MKLFKFLFSRAFLINLAIAGVITGIGYYFLMSFLEDYTRHGQKVAVPNIVGANVDDLELLLKEKGFEYVLNDSTDDNTKEKGLITGQTPKGESFVKEGRTIYISYISRQTEKRKITTQGVVNRSLREALISLWTQMAPKNYKGGSQLDISKIQNVLIDSVIYEPSDIYNDVVKELQTIKGKTIKDGDPIIVGKKINLIVYSTEVGEKVVLPNVVGKKLNDAIGDITSLQLNYFAMENNDRSCFNVKDSSNAAVVRQVPQAGSEIKTGSEVSLFYTCDTTYFKK